MKRAGLFTIIMIASIFALLHQGGGLAQRQRAQIPPARVAERAELTPAQIVTAQQRINRYFHNDVVPKLKECWRGLQGKGMVQFDYSFTKTSAGRWVLEKVSAGDSSLPADQAAKALSCMQAAARGTSFASIREDADQRTFALHWDWPVPYPTNGDILKNAMFAMRAKSGGASTTTDCDGHGAAPKCLKCDKGTCKKVCVGYTVCIDAKVVLGQTPTCELNGTCASGGPFGVGGGSRVIY